MTRNAILTSLIALASAIALLTAIVAPAQAAHRPVTEVVSIRPMPHDPADDGSSNVSGTVLLQLAGNEMRVKVRPRGLAPGLPHAQHLHAGQTCPPAAADTDDSGLITVVEGLPLYGGIQLSLTTEGDVSAGSALALDRFPVADADGMVSSDRTITLTDDQVDNF